MTFLNQSLLKLLIFRSLKTNLNWSFTNYSIFSHALFRVQYERGGGIDKLLFCSSLMSSGILRGGLEREGGGGQGWREGGREGKL